jgi:hypothetical protein
VFLPILSLLLDPLYIFPFRRPDDPTDDFPSAPLFFPLFPLLRSICLVCLSLLFLGPHATTLVLMARPGPSHPHRLGSAIWFLRHSWQYPRQRRDGAPLTYFPLYLTLTYHLSQMFIGSHNKVYIIDKAEGNPAQINGHSVYASVWYVVCSFCVLFA